MPDKSYMRGFAILLMLLVTYIAKAQVITVNDTEIDSVLIMNTKYILTPYDISCSQYETLPHSCVLLKKGDSRLYRLTEIINNLRPRRVKSLDVRSKIFIYSKNKEAQRICADGRTILTNGILYSSSKELAHFIDSLTNGLIQVSNEKNDSVMADFIIKGREKLNDKIEHLYHKYMSADNHKGYGILLLYCSANIYGEITNVSIKTMYCSVPNTKIRKIERYVKKHVLWNKNIDRSPTDRLPILFKLEF